VAVAGNTVSSHLAARSPSCVLAVSTPIQARATLSELLEWCLKQKHTRCTTGRRRRSQR
jgi:hypothetical protein